MSLAAGDSIFPQRIMFQAQKLKDPRETVRDKVRSGFVRPAKSARESKCKRMRWRGEKLLLHLSSKLALHLTK